VEIVCRDANCSPGIKGDLLVLIEDPIYRAYLRKLVGEEGLQIVDCMPGEEVTDEYVAESTGIGLNTVRRTLYLLNEHRLAKYRRERDPESGWLTYLWTLSVDNLDRALESEARKLLRKLEERLSYEKENIFYACVGGCARFVFDEASENNFVCPFCGAGLEYMDNDRIVMTLEKRMGELSAAL
jgi:transcription initiation factor TFIIE subunit alpha